MMEGGGCRGGGGATPILEYTGMLRQKTLFKDIFLPKTHFLKILSAMYIKLPLTCILMEINYLNLLMYCMCIFMIMKG